MKKTNLVEITMHFKTDKEAADVGDEIYHNLAGMPDYVESSVVLNITGSDITIIIGDEASEMAKAAILGWNLYRKLK